MTVTSNVEGRKRRMGTPSDESWPLLVKRVHIDKFGSLVVRVGRSLEVNRGPQW